MGFNLDTPDPRAVLWTAITFVVLRGLPAQVAWRPLPTALRGRGGNIRGSHGTAQRARGGGERISSDDARRRRGGTPAGNVIRVPIHLRKGADESYDVRIGRGLTPRMTVALRKSRLGQRYVIITDSHLERQGESLQAAFR